MKKLLYTLLISFALQAGYAQTAADYIIVKEDKAYKESPKTIAAMEKESPGYSKKVFLFIVNTNPTNTDKFKLTDGEGYELFDEVPTVGIKSLLAPYVKRAELNREKTPYTFAVNNSEYVIDSTHLQKYKCIQVEYSYQLKKYILLFTNDPKKYL